MIAAVRRPSCADPGLARPVPPTTVLTGDVVLVQLLDAADPETGQRYTVKRHESEKVASDGESWRHARVTLKPNNPAFEPSVPTSDDEDSLRVIAEVVQVLG